LALRPPTIDNRTNKGAFLFWTYYWPATLAMILVAAEDRAEDLTVLGYVAVYFVLAG